MSIKPIRFLFATIRLYILKRKVKKITKKKDFIY